MCILTGLIDMRVFCITVKNIYRYNILSTFLLLEILEYQVNARNKGLVLWTLQRLAELSLEAKAADSVLCLDSEGNDDDTSAAVDQTGLTIDLKLKIPQASAVSSEWFRPPSVEGVDLETCESEVATAESYLDAVRLLLTLLCLGDKANEAAIFRLLPESFSSFLSLQPSFDMVVTENENPNVTITGLKARPPPPPLGFFTTMKSAPQLKKMFQHQSSSSLQHTDSSVSCSVHSNGSPEGPVVVDTGSATTALLKSGGSDIRVAFAAKMGVHDKGLLLLN